MPRSLSARSALPLILFLFAVSTGMNTRADDEPARSPRAGDPGNVRISDVALPEPGPQRDVEADILAALDKGLSISAEDVPLKELMQRISRHFDIPIVLNE